MEFKVCSSAFEDGGYLPGWYSASGLNASPPFGWAEEPLGTKSFAMICVSSNKKVHWVLWNIPIEMKSVYGKLSANRDLTDGMHQGVNDLLATGWTGPVEKSPDFFLHFTLYALDSVLTLDEKEVTAARLEEVMDGHILGTATLECNYS